MKKYILIAIVFTLGFQTSYAQVVFGGDATTLSSNPNAPFFISPMGSDTDRRHNINVLAGKGVYFPRVDLTTVPSFGIEVPAAVPANSPLATFFDGLIVYNVGTGERTNNEIGNVEGGRFTPGFWFYDNTVGARNLNNRPAGIPGNTARLRDGIWRPVGSGSAWSTTGNTGTGNNLYCPDDNPTGVRLGTTDAAPIIVTAGVIVIERDANGVVTDRRIENRPIMHIGSGALTP